MDLATLGWVFVIVLLLFGGGMAAMALGQRLSGHCMRGSCGGPKVAGPDGEPISCATCPNRDKPAHAQERGT